MEVPIQIRGLGMWNPEFVSMKAWIWNWNMEFPDSNMDLGMELEYQKLYLELYPQSGIQDGLPTLLLTQSLNHKYQVQGRILWVLLIEYRHVFECGQTQYFLSRRLKSVPQISLNAVWRGDSKFMFDFDSLHHNFIRQYSKLEEVWVLAYACSNLSNRAWVLRTLTFWASITK